MLQEFLEQNIDGAIVGTQVAQVVLSKLCKMLAPGNPSFTPKKKEPNVVMFFGLQASLYSQREKIACLIPFLMWIMLKIWKMFIWLM
uniref:Signal recognition particle 54 kDa protein 2 n=1 Tax=Tanacetum cinerariifolium TaxID=118510 RepID=A0A6L2LUY7_TANCI|nr:signal recognition particle 54 kDa protein 2 [Tanacetum cinerariifolium]